MRAPQLFLAVVGPSEESLRDGFAVPVEKETAHRLLQEWAASPPRVVSKHKTLRPRARELLEKLLARLRQIEAAVVEKKDPRMRFAEKPAPPDAEEVAARFVLDALVLDGTLAAMGVAATVGRGPSLARLASLESAPGPEEQGKEPDRTGPAAVYDLLLSEFARAAAEPGLAHAMGALRAAAVKQTPEASDPLASELLSNLRGALASSGPVPRGLDSVIATAAGRQVLLQAVAQRAGLAEDLSKTAVGKAGPTLGLVGLALYIASVGRALAKARAPPPKPAEEDEAKS
eukprot:tig00020952_g16504.t1